jgi:hypothetical protein
MPIFIDPTKREEYVLNCQRQEKPEEQIRFLLKIMTAREWAAMASDEVAIAKADGRAPTNQDSDCALIRHGCEGWKASAGQPGSTLDKAGHLSWESLALIPQNLREELALAVWRINSFLVSDVTFSQ